MITLVENAKLYITTQLYTILLQGYITQKRLLHAHCACQYIINWYSRPLFRTHIACWRRAMFYSHWDLRHVKTRWSKKYLHPPN